MTRFLMWYDDNPKVSASQKITAAIAAYTERFKRAPNLVLMNASEEKQLLDR